MAEERVLPLVVDAKGATKMRKFSLAFLFLSASASLAEATSDDYWENCPGPGCPPRGPAQTTIGGETTYDLPIKRAQEPGKAEAVREPTRDGLIPPEKRALDLQ